jgi:serine/threonine-protein kinase
MLTTDLGACEWFVWDLRRSNLIDRGQLDQVIGEFLNKNPEPNRRPWRSIWSVRGS